MLQRSARREPPMTRPPVPAGPEAAPGKPGPPRADAAVPQDTARFDLPAVDQIVFRL